jgi:hypothetical protein
MNQKLIKLPHVTVARYSAMTRGTILRGASPYGPIYVEFDGTVLIQVRNLWVKAVVL